jgi:hypothetical protein
MRIRTIKPEFFTHEGLYDIEQETGLPIRVSFAGLWCAADREGRFKWEPRRLGVSIIPYDCVDFSRVLDACLTRGLLVKYRVGNSWFGAIPSFTKHQVVNVRERASELPSINESVETYDACPTRAPRVDDACTKEGKGKEGEGKGMEHIPAVPSGGARVEKDAVQLRAEALMKRRPSTPMSASEVRAWKLGKAVVGDTDEASWTLLEWWYGLEPERAPYRKTDFAALLNNWHAEIEKARRNKSEAGEYDNAF